MFSSASMPSSRPMKSLTISNRSIARLATPGETSVMTHAFEDLASVQSPSILTAGKAETLTSKHIAAEMFDLIEIKAPKDFQGI